MDSSGVLTATYQYDPWGNLVASTGTVENPLRFTAREYDEESGLYYLRFRYYDPEVGRFISRDPIGMHGGINLYSYVHNNPNRWRDPYGLQRFLFEIFRGRGWVEVTNMQSQMRRVMSGLNTAHPRHGPYTIWTDADMKTAELIVVCYCWHN